MCIRDRFMVNALDIQFTNNCRRILNRQVKIDRKKIGFVLLDSIQNGNLYLKKGGKKRQLLFKR
jgi:hypothetical protein